MLGGLLSMGLQESDTTEQLSTQLLVYLVHIDTRRPVLFRYMFIKSKKLLLLGGKQLAWFHMFLISVV